jgi:hypothetical protein
VEPGERLLDMATGTGGVRRSLAARGARPMEGPAGDFGAAGLRPLRARFGLCVLGERPSNV